MYEELSYIPVFRGRQQEFLVLQEFDFGSSIYPMIEIIKEKDRINNNRECHEIYSEIINKISSNKVFIDLPTYIKQTTSTQKEVIAFMNNVIDQVEQRISFFKSLSTLKNKIIPVLSSLVLIDGDIQNNDIKTQLDALIPIFEQIAFRVYLKSFDHDIPILTKLLEENPSKEFLIIYDIDQSEVTAPIVRKQISQLKGFQNIAIIRSSINQELRETHRK